MAFGKARPFTTGGAVRSTRRCSVRVRAANVLIANTKGGGHAFIGYHLTKELLGKRHKVTILNDGDKAKLSSKDPYTHYRELESQGVQVIWGSPSRPASFPRGQVDVVYDNNGKDMDACKALIDAYAKKVQHYVFVASAGAYEANSNEPMHLEGDPRKAKAGHVQVEKYLEQSGAPYTVFQPLYIYGPLTNKDCEQWFIDRIIRGRPVPLPWPGNQMTSLTHVYDVASMLAAVPGNQNAIRQHFNVCSDRCVSFNGVCNFIGEALGTKPKIVYYDPAQVKLEKGEGVPFRTMHFFASSDKAKELLGWQPQHSFKADATRLVDAYRRSGRDRKDIDFSADDKILRAVGY